jgi:hypothetical protein
MTVNRPGLDQERGSEIPAFLASHRPPGQLLSKGRVADHMGVTACPDPATLSWTDPLNEANPMLNECLGPLATVGAVHWGIGRPLRYNP